MVSEKQLETVEKNTATIWVYENTKKILDEKKSVIESKLNKNISWDELLRFILKSVDNAKFEKHIEKVNNLLSLETNSEVKK